MPQSIRVELSSENDLFFHYMHFLDEANFRAIQEQQKLMVEFPDYANVLISMLNNTIKDPHTYMAVFVMQRDGLARLDFIQNMEYKFLELLSVNFVRSPDEVVRQQICYRYNSMKVGRGAGGVRVLGLLFHRACRPCPAPHPCARPPPSRSPAWPSCRPGYRM